MAHGADKCLLWGLSSPGKPQPVPKHSWLLPTCQDHDDSYRRAPQLHSSPKDNLGHNAVGHILGLRRRWLDQCDAGTKQYDRSFCRSISVHGHSTVPDLDRQKNRRVESFGSTAAAQSSPSVSHDSRILRSFGRQDSRRQPDSVSCAVDSLFVRYSCKSPEFVAVPDHWPDVCSNIQHRFELEEHYYPVARLVPGRPCSHSPRYFRDFPSRWRRMVVCTDVTEVIRTSL